MRVYIYRAEWDRSWWVCAHEKHLYDEVYKAVHALYEYGGAGNIRGGSRRHAIPRPRTCRINKWKCERRQCRDVLQNWCLAAEISVDDATLVAWSGIDRSRNRGEKKRDVFYSRSDSFGNERSIKFMKNSITQSIGCQMSLKYNKMLLLFV